MASKNQTICTVCTERSEWASKLDCFMILKLQLNNKTIKMASISDVHAHTITIIIIWLFLCQKELAFLLIMDTYMYKKLKLSARI